MAPSLARRLLPVLLASGLLAACREEEPLLVFAAASLADALEEVGRAWESEVPGAAVEFHFAGSNDLARQIAAGAPADLFVAADRERLRAAERVDAGAAVPLLGNALVVVTSRESAGRGERSIPCARELLRFERIGLADPEAVPAGVYARHWLEAQGVWEALRERVVPALDARANLAAVASGSVPAGVVYATDAAPGEGGGLADRVRVICRVPEDEAPPVVYWAAPVADGEAGAATRFLEFLQGPPAGGLLRRHGFRHLPTESAGSAAGEPAGA